MCSAVNSSPGCYQKGLRRTSPPTASLALCICCSSRGKAQPGATAQALTAGPPGAFALAAPAGQGRTGTRGCLQLDAGDSTTSPQLFQPFCIPLLCYRPGPREGAQLLPPCGKLSSPGCVTLAPGLGTASRIGDCEGLAIGASASMSWSKPFPLAKPQCLAAEWQLSGHNTQTLGFPP